MPSLRWKLAQWLQVHWWKRHLGNKRPPSKYLEAKEMQWNNFLQRLGIAPAPQELVLDAGCGPVGIFIALGKITRVDAVDPLLSKYEKALEHFQKERYPRVHFQAVQLEHFLRQNGQPVSNRYDWIFCLNALNRFDEMDKALCTMSQALKPQGHLILSVDVHRFLLFKYLSKWLPWDLLTPQQADLQEYLKLAENCNLKREKGFLNKKGILFNYWVLVFTPA